MAVKDVFKRKVAKIADRKWSALADIWTGFPNAGATPGEAPQVELAELIAIDGILRSFSSSHPYETEQELPGLREGLLKQSIFLLQRASHAFAVADRTAESKYRCYALNAYYDAAFLACRSVVGMLGLAVLDLRDTKRHFLLDACGGIVKGTGKHALPKYWIRIIDTDGMSVNHQEWWFLLQRALQKTKHLPRAIPKHLIDNLSTLDPNDFARQRNKAQYTATYWPYDDIRINHLRANFATFSQIMDCWALLERPEDPEFLTGLSGSTVYLGHRLLEAISQESGQFIDDFQTAQEWLFCCDQEVIAKA